MSYPNLKEAAPYYNLAYFANITPELLSEVLKGNEDLTALEVMRICQYTGIPHSVLFNRKLIKLDQTNYRHWNMLSELENKIDEIWEWQKKGSHEADRYMEYQKDDFIRINSSFRLGWPVPYVWYLGVKKKMDDALLYIKCEQDKIHNKPRGIKREVGAVI